MNWIKKLKKFFQEHKIRKLLLIGSLPTRRDLEYIPVKQEFDKYGNCLHTTKAWKTVLVDDGRMFNIRCCQHCDKEWPEELMERLEQERIENKSW